MLQLQLNALTRKLGKKMLAAASIGMDGWIFADLLEHEYMVYVLAHLLSATDSATGTRSRRWEAGRRSRLRQNTRSRTPPSHRL